MQIIGFYFTKISAEKQADKIISKPITSIEFLDVQKEDVGLLKNADAVKIHFKYALSYGDKTKKEKTQAELVFEGRLVFSAESKEIKDILNGWKKKEINATINFFLSNMILRKCTPKAIALQDELNLPFHTPMPRLTAKEKSS